MRAMVFVWWSRRFNIMSHESWGISGQWYPQWLLVYHLKYLYIKHHCFVIGQKKVVWLCLVSLYCEMQNYSMSAHLDIPVWQQLQGYCTFWHPKLNPGQKTPVPWPQPTSHLINGNTKTDVKHNCYPLFLFIKIFPLPSCFCKSLWCGRVCFWQPVRGNFSFQDWIFEQIPSWSRFSHLSFLFFYVLWQYRGTSLAPPCQITLSSW